jgi:tetrahydromethanopterin S-methyltransferase subunit B
MDNMFMVGFIIGLFVMGIFCLVCINWNKRQE